MAKFKYGITEPKPNEWRAAGVPIPKGKQRPRVAEVDLDNPTQAALWARQLDYSRRQMNAYSKTEKGKAVRSRNTQLQNAKKVGRNLARLFDCFARDGFACFLCGMVAPDDPRVVASLFNADHWVPGKHWEGSEEDYDALPNRRALCFACNNAKKDFHPEGEMRLIKEKISVHQKKCAEFREGLKAYGG